jgi:hypothetical protein
MSSLSSLYFTEEKLQILLDTVRKKQAKGVELTISIADETNNFGQNVSSFVSQSKEDREAKKQKFYVANGKCFWTDGKITKAEQQAQPQQSAPSQDDDSLPF